jgi:hypothetical protein
LEEFNRVEAFQRTFTPTVHEIDGPVGPHDFSNIVDSTSSISVFIKPLVRDRIVWPPTDRIANDTKPCKVCAEPIKKAARVCTHCNNYQDWRAELNVSSTVLSLMVALVSVTTAALPVVRDAMTEKNSDLSFTFQGVNEDVIGILVTNQGARPGTVSYPMYLLEDTFAVVELKVVGDLTNAVFIVEPGKSMLLQLTGMPGGLLTNLNTGDSKAPKPQPRNNDCSISIQQSDFKAYRDTKLITMPCDQLRYFTDNYKVVDAKREAERIKQLEKERASQQRPSATSLPAAK